MEVRYTKLYRKGAKVLSLGLGKCKGKHAKQDKKNEGRSRAHNSMLHTYPLGCDDRKLAVRVTTNHQMPIKPIEATKIHSLNNLTQ